MSQHSSLVKTYLQNQRQAPGDGGELQHCSDVHSHCCDGDVTAGFVIVSIKHRRE